MPRNRNYTIFEASDILHQAGALHSTNVHLDYGTGEKYTSTEVHTLSYIVQNPGISVTDLAHDTGKTKGAISQMVKKLEAKGLLRREIAPHSDKISMIYATEAGLELHRAHKQYDAVSFGKTYKALCEIYSPEEVNAAWTILDTLVQLQRHTNTP
jgi:DNA-binding MarR family transcriptional regulator